LGHGYGRPDLLFKLFPAQRVGIREPSGEALDRRGLELTRRQSQLFVQIEDSLDVLPAPWPELVMREAGLLDLPKPVQERKLAPGHLDVDRVSQPGSIPG